jgi:hypothetical protein
VKAHYRGGEFTASFKIKGDEFLVGKVAYGKNNLRFIQAASFFFEFRSSGFFKF